MAPPFLTSALDKGKWLASQAADLPQVKTKLNSVAVVRKWTIWTERPQLVGEVSAKLCGYRVLCGQRNEFPRPLISVF
jgi:hypothetical protein